MPRSDCQLRRLLTTLAIGLFTLPAHAHASVDNAWQQATQLYQAHQWKQAATAFDRLAADPGRDVATRQNAQLYAGEALMQLGQYADAIRRYQVAQQQNLEPRQAAQTQFRLGEAAWLAGNGSVASAQLQAYVDRFPDDASVGYAREYLSKIHTRKTIEQDFATLDEAVGWQREGRHDAALAAYHDILQQQSNGSMRAEALRRGAQLHDQLAQSREALSLYQKFLAENPDSPRTAEVLLAVARLHQRLDQPAQAVEQFRTLHAKFPQSAQSADAAYWLALSHADENNADEARGYVDWLLAVEGLPTDRPGLWSETLCLKCQLASDQGKWNEIDQLVEASREHVHNGTRKTKLEFWAAEAAFRLRRYDQASERFAQLQPRTAGSNAPWAPMVPLRLAQLAARQQRWGEVLEILDELERDFPAFALDYEVDYLRGRALAGRGEMTAARRFYGRVRDNRAAAGTEAAVMAAWMTGETYFHQRDYARARTEYEQVMEQTALPQWQSRAALQAGKCWELENQWHKAQRVYSLALNNWPNSDSDDQLQARLRWAEGHSQTLQPSKTLHQSKTLHKATNQQ